MGLKWSSQSSQFDFVAQLPPKVVSLIVSFLCPRDVRNCLLVSKRWRENFLHLEPYWLSALSKLGCLQWNISVAKTKKLANLKEVYVAVLKHQKTARNMTLVSAMATCYPHYLAASCCVMDNRNVLVREEEAGNAVWLREEEIVCVGSIVGTRCINSVKLRKEDVPVTWAHHSACGDLWWANSKGVCELYPGDPASSVSLTHRLLSCQAQGEVVDINFKEQESVKVGFTEGPVSGDKSEDKMFGGCPKCSMVLTCGIKSEGMKSHLKIQIMNPRNQPAIETASLAHKYSSVHCVDWRPSILVGSASEINGKGNICQTHYILIQEAHPVIIFLKEDSSSVASCCQKQFMVTHQECISCSYSPPQENVHRNLKPSLSGVLLAGVYQQRLWVWKVTDGALKLLSKAEIGETDPTLNYELIAVGECLSVVRRLEDKAGDTIAIVQTASGQILNQLSEWIPRNTEVHSHATKWHFFLSVNTQHWLSDFKSPYPPQTLLTAACEDATGRLVFVLVQTQSAACSEEHEKDRHWVQAKNYLFHQNHLCVYS